MCYHFCQTSDPATLAQRFNLTASEPPPYTQADNINGFGLPRVAVIASNQPQTLQSFSWGLVPHWAKDTSFGKHTLNARIETLKEKPSYRGVTHQRCLVPAQAFYEWQWQDDKGKKKQKYRITLKDRDTFAFAGLWSRWDKADEPHYSCTIITTQANELMAEIHNTKKRMPCVLTSDNQERDWLHGDMPIDLLREPHLNLQATALY